MDSAHKALQTLLTFPPEIWALIFENLTIWPIGRLKMTGSKFLWHRITAPHAVESIIIDDSDSGFAQWPAFLSDFTSVQNFEISSLPRNFYDEEAFRLSLLPTSIRKLKVGLNLGMHFLQTLTFADQLPKLEELDFLTNQFEVVPYLGELQNLTILKIQSWNSSHSLPPKLVELYVNETLHAEDGATLPETLEIIDAGTGTQVERLLPSLPSTLRTLKFVRLIMDPTEGALPLRLETFQADFRSFPAEYLNGCPSLTELCANYLLPEYWTHLPPTLKTLKLICADRSTAIVPRTFPNSQYPFNTIPIHLLPKSITSLDINVNEESGCSSPLVAYVDFDPPESTSPAIELYPTQLTTLALTGCLVTENAAKHFPPCLTDLKLSCLDTPTAKSLPTGLKRLTVDTFTQRNGELWKFLPATLTYLELTYQGTTWVPCNIGFETSFETIASMALFQVVESIEPLWTEDVPLPPNLTYLSLTGIACPIANCHFPLRGLSAIKTLNLQYSGHFTNDAIQAFPPTLTELKLTPGNGDPMQIHASKSQITGECFKYLPRNLKSLILLYPGHLMDSQIEDLPRDLRYLELCDSSLTEACLTFLPRDIRGFRTPTATHGAISSTKKLGKFYFEITPPDPSKVESLRSKLVEKITTKLSRVYNRFGTFRKR